MRRLLSALVLLAAVASSAYAWQFISRSSGTAAAKVPLYPVAMITSGNAGAANVQVKNTGDGVLTVSFHRYDSAGWRAVMPANARTGQSFVGISDSVITLGPGELISTLDRNVTDRVHVLYITRPVATSYKVAYK